MAQPTLTFKTGRFIVTHPPTSHGPVTDWTWLEPSTYATTSLKAAATLRRFSDETTKKILDRVFQTHYDLPEWLRDPGPKNVLRHLDATQMAGLEWVLSRKRSYLAHAPGAGKTLVALVASLFAENNNGNQTLLIVPPSLTRQWASEFDRMIGWAAKGAQGWLSIAIVPSSANQADMYWGANYIICPDSMLAKDWVSRELSKRKFNFIAVDEASRLKEPFSQRSLAFYGGTHEGENYPGLFRDVRHVVFLDGSPMPNRPIELWAPTYALHPEAIDCMDYNAFGYRYCGAKPNERGVWEFNYSSNEEELKAKLQKDFMHVVTEDQLDHPERRRSILLMNQDVRSPEHRKWEKTWESVPRGKDPFHDVAMLGDDASEGDLARFRRELGVRKAPWVAKYAAERLRDKNESILIFAWHREVCDILAAKLAEFNPGLINGGVAQAARDAWVKSFQEGKTRCLILNIGAAGRGLNLQRADRVLFAEYSWTDELNKQAEKRASRRGNDRAYVRCEYIVSPGSLDERILRSLFTKQKRVERIIG